jgi:hypothetical protein
MDGRFAFISSPFLALSYLNDLRPVVRMTFLSLALLFVIVSHAAVVRNRGPQHDIHSMPERVHSPESIGSDLTIVTHNDLYGKLIDL